MSKTPVIANAHPAAQLLTLLGLALICVASAILVFGLVTGGLPAINPADPSTIAPYKTLQIINAICAFILPCILYLFMVSNEKLKYIGLQSWRSKFSFPLVLILVFVALPAINWLSEMNQIMVFPDFLSDLEQWFRHYEKEAQVMTEAFLATKTVSGYLLNLFMVGVLAAVGEELMFRGIIQRIMGDMWKNKHTAIWVTAFLFSAMHMQFYGFIPRLLLGAMLGYLLLWSGSLWLPILAHFINNATAVTLSYLSNIGVLPEGSEDIGGLENILLSMGSIVVTLGILYLVRKFESPPLPQILRPEA